MSSHLLISTNQLAARLGDHQIRILDCRFSLADKQAGERNYLQGHIPGAVFADLERDLSAAISPGSGRHPLPDSEQLISKLRAWGISNNSEVVVYDDMQGAMAARMWWLLRWLGHEQVALLDGGINKWNAEGRELETQIPKYPAGQFKARADNSAWLTTEQIEHALAQQSIVLIDARSAARFAAEEEPIDPVAGHIPGALNRPFQCNLNSAGTFLSPDALRQSFAEITSYHPPQQVVHMCGSGVTACHNLFAMELAGIAGSKLYVGSWSEWIRDPARPIVQHA